MANWFPTALKNDALSWHLNLSEGSISSWDELCKRFITNFQGTCNRALGVNDLWRVK